MTQENIVQILVGRRDRYFDGQPIGRSRPIWENTYSLVIDGECVASGKNQEVDRAARYFANLLENKKIFDYELINGKRNRFTTRQVVDTDEMLRVDLEMFRGTIDSLLAEKKDERPSHGN